MVRTRTGMSERVVGLRGPLTLTLFCAIPVVLWMRALPLDQRFGDLPISLISIGAILGVAGASAFGINLMLGARLPFLQAYFGGLERMYAAHRANGRVAFLLLLAHALFILGGHVASSPRAALDLFVPSQTGWQVIYGLVALVSMAVAITLTLYVRLSHELFIYVQRTFGIVFLVAGLHVFLTPGTKALSAGLTGYLGTLWSAAVLSWAYRSLFGNLLVRRHTYRVVSVERLDRTVVEITMAPDGKPLRHRPGQFVYVTFYSSAFAARFHPFSATAEGSTEIITFRPGDVRNQFHPFSLTSDPSGDNLKIAVKAVGDFTHKLQLLDEGARAVLEGPYGEFTHLNAANPRQVWIAGGIGITPFLSMARSLDAGGRDIHLYYGVKNLESAHFLADLRALGDTKGFHVHVVPEDREGFVTLERIESETGDPTASDFLLCGPPAMIQNLRGQLEARGVGRDHIHYERFGFGPN